MEAAGSSKGVDVRNARAVAIVVPAMHVEGPEKLGGGFRRQAREVGEQDLAGIQYDRPEPERLREKLTEQVSVAGLHQGR